MRLLKSYYFFATKKGAVSILTQPHDLTMSAAMLALLTSDFNFLDFIDSSFPA